MLSLKQLFITTSISVILGYFSIVHLFLHIKRIEDASELRFQQCQSLLNESNERYELLYNDYQKLKAEFAEYKSQTYSHIVNQSFISPVSTSESLIFSDDDTDHKNTNTNTICDELCTLTKEPSGCTMTESTLSDIDRLNVIFNDENHKDDKQSKGSSSFHKEEANERQERQENQENKERQASKVKKTVAEEEATYEMINSIRPLNSNELQRTEPIDDVLNGIKRSGDLLTRTDSFRSVRSSRSNSVSSDRQQQAVEQVDWLDAAKKFIGFKGLN
jgi:hypothetical protein